MFSSIILEDGYDSSSGETGKRPVKGLSSSNGKMLRESFGTAVSIASIDVNDMNDDPALAGNKKLALNFLNLAFANRVQETLALLSEDATWWVLGDPQRLKVSGSKNRRQIERLLTGLTRTIPGGMQIVVHGITAEYDRVAVEVESAGIWHNGKRYHNHYHFLLKIRAGEVLQVREYMDTLHVSDMLAG